MDQELDQKLTQYSKSNVYPFHMPGHKRVALDQIDPYSIDITEIDDFDNLHHAEEIIKEAQDRARDMYGARESHYLINGSSCGILTAIFATCKRGDRILVARNCHKSVFHASLIRELKVDYVYPQKTASGIQGPILAQEVRRKLSEHDYQAVVITSPTYDGVVSDIKEIAKAVHEMGIPLIVDEAHGAHFGFHRDFPVNAGRRGADLVIMSTHKTLPSFTQTALFHRYCDEELVSEDNIRKYLGVFETSSPSYLFMAGMERALRYIREDKDYAFSHYSALLNVFRDNCRDLKHIKVLGKEDIKEAFDFDKGKLLLVSKVKTYSGMDLAQELLHEHKLQMEMAAGSYCLAMTSIMDTKEGFFRLSEALHKIDKRLEDLLIKLGESGENVDSEAFEIYQPYSEKEAVMTIAEADQAKEAFVDFDQAVGKISKAYIFLYPPGIPLIVPGERVDEELIEALRECERRGLNLEGLVEGRLKIVN